jgi:DNA-binding response OmpR family regulator
MNNDYDILLLDIMLPIIDGVTLCKKILEQKKIPIIMITAKDTVEDKIY